MNNTEQKYLVCTCRSCFNNKRSCKIEVRKHYAKLEVICMTCDKLICSFKIEEDEIAECECCKISKN